MFNKFELIGISLSMGSMALALYLINSHMSVPSLMASVPKESQSAFVSVASNTNPQEALRTAIVDAANPDGTVKKLIINDVVVGTGPEVTVGDTVTVHYVGALQNGDEFDNSRKRGTPFSFTMGEGKVITGWEEGMVGMKAGGKRVLVIPADMAYGDRGYGPIPGGATLVFAVELLDIKSAKQ